MITVRMLPAAVMVAAGLLAACSGDDTPAGSRAGAPGAVTGTARRADATFLVVDGTARLDGRPLSADFLGAVVTTPDGLVTPCQAAIPEVRGGEFRIPVLARSVAAGCGARGRAIVLWTFVDGQKVFSPTRIPWSDSARDPQAVTFTSADPSGGLGSITEYVGEVHDAGGTPVAGNPTVTAYVDGHRCGVGSVHEDGDFNGYVINIAGPDRNPGCRAGAPVMFRVDGVPVPQTGVNDGLGHRDFLDLTLPATNG